VDIDLEDSSITLVPGTAFIHIADNLEVSIEAARKLIAGLTELLDLAEAGR
jgi:hypothetical protein